ncbi:MAG: methyl-accepting chemotaxis protein [Alphaproteobacteria bacterium]|nr:methyl-accepting chemotaxis protein [Alphaproteobacteria bacterium]
MAPFDNRLTASASTTVDDPILGFLDALTVGRFDQQLVDDGTDLAQAVIRLGESLRRRALAGLDHAVSTSMAITRGATLTAELLVPIERTAHQAQSMAAAVEEMVTAVRQIDTLASTSSGAAEAAQTSVGAGVVRIGEAVTAFNHLATLVEEAAVDVRSLGAASAEIGGILGSIERISSQTRLLALNATIEAARAGEAGRGFAVVASEVKQLAQQTADATDDIRRRIDVLQSQVHSIAAVMDRSRVVATNGHSIIDTLGRTIDEIGREIHGVSEHMGEIASLLREESQAADQIASGVASVAAMADENVGAIRSLADACAAAERAIDVQLKDAAEIEFPGKIIRLAKADHVIWKRKLVAMAVGAESLNPDELADHHCCRLGKWYYGPASEPWRGLAAFKALEAPHARVHTAGIAAARHFAAHRLTEGLAELSNVEAASQDVLLHLGTLGRSD